MPEDFNINRPKPIAKATSVYPWTTLRKTTSKDTVPSTRYILTEKPEGALDTRIAGNDSVSSDINEVMIACASTESAPVVELYGGSIGGPLVKIAKLSFTQGAKYTDSGETLKWCSGVVASELGFTGAWGVQEYTDGVLSCAGIDSPGHQFLVAYVTGVANDSNTDVLLRYI